MGLLGPCPPLAPAAAMGQDIGDLALREPPLEFRVVSVEAVDDDGAEGDAGGARLLDEVDGDLRLGAKARILRASGEARCRRVGSDVQRVVHPCVQSVGTATMPLSILPTEPGSCRPTCAVAVPSFRSPVSSSTSTPPRWAAMAASLCSSARRRALSGSALQSASERKYCKRWAAGLCACTTGSAPARRSEE